MESFMKQGSVSPQNPKSGGQSKESGKKRRREKGEFNHKMTLTTWKSNRLSCLQKDIANKTTNTASIKHVWHVWIRPLYFLSHVFLLIWEPCCQCSATITMDCRSQAKCNWAKRAASRRHVFIITNYNRVQGKLSELWSKPAILALLSTIVKTPKTCKHKMENSLVFFSLQSHTLNRWNQECHNSSKTTITQRRLYIQHIYCCPVSPHKRHPLSFLQPFTMMPLTAFAWVNSFSFGLTDTK